MTVKRAGRYRLERKQPFEIAHHRTNHYIRSTVTFPICTVSVGSDIDGLIDMMGFDFDCNYTDKNRRACFWFHLNPLYMNTVRVHLLRNSHFVIKSKQII